MIILGIETSCDETSASIISAKSGSIQILSNIVSSQVKLHAKWGGVVPNLAAREHLKNILPIIEESLEKANKTPKEIDLISVTNGPGLIPALLVGVNTAKTLSYIWNKPLMGIHHVEGHIYANFIDRETRNVKLETSHGDSVSTMETESPVKSPVNASRFTLHASRFPILCLVVSGGHTQLVLMKKHLDYEIVGETQDDAAGEAFDKVARILNLGYPGGPAIAQRAMEFPISNSQFPNNFKIQNSKFKTSLPRPMIKSNNFNFSFSGLKTAVLYETKRNLKLLKNKEYIQEVCHEFQQAVIDVLISKTLKAAKKYDAKTIMLAGGVSANLELRKQMEEACEKEIPGAKYLMPNIAYSGDNAAMIAAAAYFRFEKTKDKNKLTTGWKTLSADANLKLK